MSRANASFAQNKRLSSPKFKLFIQSLTLRLVSCSSKWILIQKAEIKDLHVESTQAIFTKYMESCRYVSCCCLQLLLLCTEISFLNAKIIFVSTLLKVEKRPLCPLHSDVHFPHCYMSLFSFINYGQHVILEEKYTWHQCFLRYDCCNLISLL